MGLMRRRKSQPEPVMSADIVPAAPVFSTVVDSGTLYGVQTIDEALRWMQGFSRITRREAITVPAVKAARDKIAGAIGQLPLRVLDGDNRVVTDFSPSLFPQPEEGTASTVTWTNVVDDLMFSKYAYLSVTARGWHGKPAAAVRLDPETTTYRPDLRVFKTASGNGTANEWQADANLIRIESPNDALLVAGARAIRVLGRLEVAALNSAEGVPPMDYFTPAEGVDPVGLGDPEDPEVQEFIRSILDGWGEARRTRSTAFVPAALKYNTNAFNPQQLQLVEAREMAIAEVARLTGIDTDDLGLNTTSRVYFNAQDRRRAFTDIVLGPYMRAIETRLSMDDVTPRGLRVRFDTADFTKADDLDSAQTDEILVRSGVLTINEVRERRGLQPLDNPQPPAPAKVPEQEEASA